MRNFIEKVKRKVFPKVNDKPVYILGKEKSGTTAIAKLLAVFAGKTLTSDIPPIWGQPELDLYSNKESYKGFVHANKQFFYNDIIKEPGLSFIFPQVKAAFPNAKFVMIIRDPRDNIRSIFNRLKLEGTSEDLHLDKIPKNWQHVISNHVFGIEGDIIERASKRWNMSVDVYLENKSDFILVRYEDFIENKLEAIKTLSEALGWRECNDISSMLNKQFQPKGNRDISWEKFFGLINLRKIESCCAKNMKAVGYEL